MPITVGTLYSNVTGSTNMTARWDDFWTSTSSTNITVTYNMQVWENWNTAYEVSAEQAAEQRRRMEEVGRRHREAQALRDRAEESARSLLVSLLSKEQAEEFSALNRITVVAPSGRTYRLFRGTVGNIALMDGEARRATLCVHPRGDLPVSDMMAGQLLAIVHDEEHFLRKANLHTGQWSDEELALRRGPTQRALTLLAAA